MCASEFAFFGPSLDDFNVTVDSTFGVYGPKQNRDFVCTLGVPCALALVGEGFAGSNLAPGGMGEGFAVTGIQTGGGRRRAKRSKQMRRR